MGSFFRRFFPDDGDAVEGYHDALAAHMAGCRRVLDLGCGGNAELARYRTGGREVWGADLAAHPRLRHRRWFRPLRPDGGIPLPDGWFDLIAARWVLEHVRDPGAFLAEVRRALRPSGRLVALTVNGGHYVTWVTRLLGQLPHGLTQWLVRRLYGREPHDTFPTYYRLNTPGQFRRLARRGGLELAHLTRLANPDYFSFSPTLRRVAVLVDWLLERAGTGLGRLYVVTVLRRPGAAVQEGRWAA
jgi:SAM-dependent methyltransferase